MTPVLEDGVAVRVYREGYPMPLDDAPQQEEIALGVFLLMEECVGHRAGGIVNGQQQGEPGPSVPQPGMMAPIELEQHALLGHPLAAVPVARRSAVARAG